MLITLFIISIIMFSFLLYYYKRMSKRIFQYMAFTYILLFGSVSISVGSYLIYTADYTWVLAAISDNRAPDSHSVIRNSLHRKLKPEIKLEAPVIKQFPELPRGCEVTSLTMLLQYHDIDTDKLTLAKELKRDNTPYEKKNGIIYFGDPNTGFVGDMYSFHQPGLGVYHQPLYELAKHYAGENAIDLTGQSFQSMMASVSSGEPVLAITNITYQPLPASSFQIWQTPNGPVKITKKLHAVLVTGYDHNFIYFNDPYDGKQKKAPKQAFIAAWEQMGKQAISISR
ncbi:peptidase C39 [Gracilibacillus oryzae]|uniref:Peptidase C39 n=1 Tax=Gracilibacillus oryzae TaxID=1672701 RepID=A0A7C8GSE1_9BACI|nr:C39 family peptidase [Gracilibacillus oryzae]KAB8131480.1 peptidase C39 [Gracilibacillus oryzae]